MRSVNLLPGAPRRRRRSGPGMPMAVRGAGPVLAVAAGALVLGGLGWWGYTLRQDADSLRGDVAQATVARDALRTELADFRAMAQRDEMQRARRGAVVSLVAGRTDWERLVRDVSIVMPSRVWLTNLAATSTPATTTATAASGAAAAGSSSLRLEGVARSQPQVALVMARLGAVAGLGEPRLESSTNETIGTTAVTKFVITTPVDRRAQGRPTLTAVGGTTEATP